MPPRRPVGAWRIRTPAQWRVRSQGRQYGGLSLFRCDEDVERGLVGCHAGCLCTVARQGGAGHEDAFLGHERSAADRRSSCLPTHLPIAAKAAAKAAAMAGAQGKQEEQEEQGGASA